MDTLLALEFVFSVERLDESNSSGVYICNSIVNELRHGFYICKSEENVPPDAESMMLNLPKFLRFSCLAHCSILAQSSSVATRSSSSSSSSCSTLVVFSIFFRWRTGLATEIKDRGKVTDRIVTRPG